MLLTQKEVASQLRISLKTLQVWRKQGKIPFLKWGHRTIRFSSAEIEKLQLSTNPQEQSPVGK